MAAVDAQLGADPPKFCVATVTDRLRPECAEDGNPRSYSPAFTLIQTCDSYDW